MLSIHDTSLPCFAIPTVVWTSFLNMVPCRYWPPLKSDEITCECKNNCIFFFMKIWLRLIGWWNLCLYFQVSSYIYGVLVLTRSIKQYFYIQERSSKKRRNIHWEFHADGWYMRARAFNIYHNLCATIWTSGLGKMEWGESTS